MKEKEKAEAGFFYDARDEEILKGLEISQELSFNYNSLHPSQYQKREDFIRKNFKKTGDIFRIEQPFHCDFWDRVSIGENFFSNYNFVILAANMVTIGNDVFIGPNCGLYAASHPFDAEKRNAGIEYAWPICIGNSVWLGGGVNVIGGVTIGDGTVIAAGSVVINNIPANVLAGGNPCQVIRKLSKEDDEKYKHGFFNKNL